MLRERTQGYIVVRYRWILLMRLLLLGLLTMVIAGVTLVMRQAVDQANAAYQEEAVASDARAAEREMMKTVLLKWMKTKSDMPDQVLATIYDAAATNGSGNTDLILAICLVESNFNPNARSEKGAIGLMGISPIWVKELKERRLVNERRELYLIANNIASGAYVLRTYLSRTRDIEKALFGYVGGDYVYADKVFKALGEIYLARMAASG